MDSLDEHFASIQNTILTSTSLINASFVSCAQTRNTIRIQHEALDRMHATLEKLEESDPFHRL